MHILTVIHKFPFISWSVVPSPKGLGFLIFLPVFVLPLPSPVTLSCFLASLWPFIFSALDCLCPPPPPPRMYLPMVETWAKQNVARQGKAQKLSFCLGARAGTWGGDIWAGVQQVCGMWGGLGRGPCRENCTRCPALPNSTCQKNNCLNYSDMESVARMRCFRDIFPNIRKWVVSSRRLEFCSC